MIRTRSRTPDSMFLESMIPLAGITFLLLAFFLLGRSFVESAGVDVESPAVLRDSNRADPIVVRVTSPGTIHLDGRLLDLAALRRAVEDAHFRTPAAPVVVLVEEGARASLIVRIVDQCKLSGARDIRLSIERPERS